MTPSRVFASIFLLAAFGCESDPAPASGFHDKIVRESEVAGRVYHGRAPAEGALVMIAGTHSRPFPPADKRDGGDAYAPQSLVTAGAGSFRFDKAAPLYDLFVRLDRQVLVREGIALRYTEPSFDGVGARREWSARLDPSVEGARPGHSIRFFAGSDKVLSLTGDLANGLAVAFPDFTSRVAVVALEIPDGGDLTNAVASAKAEVDVLGDSRAPIHFVLAPILESKSVTFAMKDGAGFVPGVAEVLLDFGSFDQRVPIARVPLGEKRTFALAPAGFIVILHAAKDGAELDSGHVFFDFGKPVFEVPLPDAAPVLGAEPAAGTFIEPNALLSAPEPGVVEHLLEPVDTGATITIGTASGAARLPDVATLGLPRAAGWYRWRVRRYTKIDFIDQLSGPFLRAGPSAWSAPRTIALQ